MTTPPVTAAPDGPREQRQGTPAACAAPGLPKRAGVPPATTWSVQPEESLRLLASPPPGPEKGPRDPADVIDGHVPLRRSWSRGRSGGFLPARQVPGSLAQVEASRYSPRRLIVHLRVSRTAVVTRCGAPVVASGTRVARQSTERKRDRLDVPLRPRYGSSGSFPRQIRFGSGQEGFP
jgi:hypothetical protein